MDLPTESRPVPLITWNDSLTLGLPSIDQQHKQLVELLNSLHDAMVGRQGQQKLGAILDGLANYTIEHFSYEEGLLAQYQYREAATHAALHQHFKTKIAEFREELSGGRIAMSTSVLAFLQGWLTSHICETDARYVRHLRAKGAR